MRPEQLFYKVAAEDTARPEGRERPEMPRMEDYTKSLTGIAGAAGSGALMTKYLPMTSDFAKKHPIARGALYAGGLSAGGLAVRAGVDLGRHTAYHTGQAASKGIEAGKRAVNYRRDDNSSSTPKYKALRQFDSEREKNAETVGLGIGLKEGPRAYGIRAAKGDEDERGLAFSYDVVPAAVAGVPLGAAVAAATNSPSLMATVLREKNRNAAISSAIQDAAIARAEVERLKNQYALRMDAARDVADSDGSGAEEIARKMRAAAAAVDPADFVPSPEVVKALGRRARAAAGGALSGMATAAAAQGLHNMAQYYTGKVLANPSSTSESGDPEPTTEEYADIQDPPEKKKAWHHSRTRFRITNSMGKKAEVEYRGKKFPGYNQPVDSDRPEKKKMVLAKKGDKVKLIHFGQKGYKHNYSEAAKKDYLTRSAGIRGKDGSLTANDKFSANYWARRELWPKNEPADGSARNREKRASDDAFRDYLLSMGALTAGTLRHRANTSHEPAVAPAKKKDEGMKKIAYGDKEHRGLAGVTASGAKSSGQARDLLMEGALATDKGIRHPWLPHTDNLHSFAGSQSRAQIGAGIAGRQQSAVSDIAKSIAGAKGKDGVTGYLKSGVRGVRGLMNAGDTQHSLVDISAHYNKPLSQGTGSILRNVIPQTGYGGGIVGGREHVNAEKLLRNVTGRGDGSSAIEEIDQLRPSVNPDDAQAVTRSRRFGAATRRQVESALVAQHGMTPEQATRAADEFFNRATFSDASKRLGTISRDVGYVRQEAGRAAGALKGALSGLLTRGRA